MVRFMAGLGLGLGLNVDIHNGTIMTITEEPSPNLIGRQINDIFRCTAAYPLET